MATTLTAYPTRRNSRPPSIAVYGSSYRSRTIDEDDDHRLYDLPKAASPVVTTASPRNSRLVSPTSPVFSNGHAGTLSPPAPRSRPLTPVPEPQKDDLEQFAETCRAWYFKQNEEASRKMTQTLASIPSSQRATYSRLQAAIRADYHATTAARRNAEFLARLHAVTPGGTLSAHMRAEPLSSAARKERASRLDAFLRAWCTSGMPGTKPFFEALWAVMRLQVLPVELGGAGPRRIEWEIDDAVFKEAAGKDFMLEAIDVLKGVLGFEDSAASKRSGSWSRPASIAEHHQRTRSQPLQVSSSPSKVIATTTPSSRARAPSDPFLDNHVPGLSRSLASSQPRSPTTPTGEQSPEVAGLLLQPVLQTSPDEDDDDAASDQRNEEYSRVWTVPNLHDSEFTALLRLFPNFVGQRQLPRFPVSSTPRAEDIEATAGEQFDTRAVRFGTGRFWVGVRMRSSGYRGGIWSRFIAWWRRMFGR